MAYTIMGPRIIVYRQLSEVVLHQPIVQAPTSVATYLYPI